MVYEIKDANGVLVAIVWIDPTAPCPFTVTQQESQTQGGGGPGSGNPPK